MEDHYKGETDPLSDPVIRSYYEANLTLAKTIAVKHQRAAEHQNADLVAKFGPDVVNEDAPTTWKYYQNLAGLYHVTDEPMTITSLDTLTTITFTRQNLQNHPNTRSEYKFGSPYYQTLVSRYPKQEDLIMGILMPCNINDAINAEDGTILRWDTSLVEEQEYSLMKELETGIKNHLARWYVDAYNKSDEYWLMLYFAYIAMYIFPALFNLREARRNTHEVHSFHVRMELRGYMNLDQYYPYLTRKQAMYLYRNLPRLVRYIGHDRQFQELVQNLLTERGIQLYGYTLRQTNEIGLDYSPVVVVQAEPINKIQPDTATETIEPRELFQKESTVLYGTSDYYDAEEERVMFKLKNQDTAKIITKDVITQTEDTVQPFSMTLPAFLLNHWAYMSATGTYNPNVTFQNPKTGNFHTVPAKAAFSYLYYLSLSYSSQTLIEDAIKGVPDENLPALVALSSIPKSQIKFIPSFIVQHHVAPIKPDLQFLLNVVETGYRNSLSPVAVELLDEFVALSNITTPQLFYNQMLAIFKNYVVQQTRIDSYTHQTQQAYVQSMTYRLYRDTMVSFEPSNKTIETFLAEYGLDAYETFGSDLPGIIQAVYEAGTGSSGTGSGGQASVTEAMIAIMRLLSSYNIQFIDIVSENALTYAQMKPINIHGYISPGSGSPEENVTNVALLPIGVSFMDVTEIPH